MPTSKPKQMHAVLIDDDKVYNAVMLRAAELVGIKLDVFTSLAELGSVALLGRYDVAIVDYQLEQMTGLEVAAYLSAFFDAIPMVLVSHRETPPENVSAWPRSIATFIPKRAGYQHVLERAANIAGRQGGEEHRKMAYNRSQFP